MRKILLAAVAAVGLASSAFAADVRLFVDSAPNSFGSPNYAPWRADAFQDASDNTFVNFANGTFAGTTNFAAPDAMVYSSGDLGKRLHFVYFIPNTTKQALTGNIEVRMSFDWDSTIYYDFAGTNATTFVAPNFANLVEINGGVAGTFGDAFWPTATDAPDFGVFDQADKDAIAADMYQYQTFWKGEVRVRDSSTAPWTTGELTANLVNPVVPTPAAAGAGLVLLAGLAMKRRTA